MTADVAELRSKVFTEARLVTRKAERWAAMAEDFKSNRQAFLRPATKMKKDAERVTIAAGICDDPYALAVLLDDMMAYTVDG